MPPSHRLRTCRLRYLDYGSRKGVRHTVSTLPRLHRLVQFLDVSTTSTLVQSYETKIHNRRCLLLHRLSSKVKDMTNTEAFHSVGPLSTWDLVTFLSHAAILRKTIMMGDPWVLVLSAPLLFQYAGSMMQRLGQFSSSSVIGTHVTTLKKTAEPASI